MKHSPQHNEDDDAAEPERKDEGNYASDADVTGLVAEFWLGTSQLGTLRLQRLMLWHVQAPEVLPSAGHRTALPAGISERE